MDMERRNELGILSCVDCGYAHNVVMPKSPSEQYDMNCHGCGTPYEVHPSGYKRPGVSEGPNPSFGTSGEFYRSPGVI